MSLLSALYGFHRAFDAVAASSQNAYVSVFSSRLILDAGHGGFDGGATGVNGAYEKDINLSVTKKAASLARLMGFSVVTVRDEDCAVNDGSASTLREKKVSDIHNRLALTEKYPDAVFLSIHQNHFPDPSCRGAQVFYGANSPLSRSIAEKMQKSLRENIAPDNDREIKKAEKNLYILYNAKTPAVLLECGFLSNADECLKLCDSEYQQKIAFCAVTSVMECVTQT